MRNLILAATALTAVASTSMAVDAKLYGTVNKAFMAYDDGESTESTIVDSNMESTRFGFGGEQKLDNGLTASALFEVEMRSNPSEALTQNGTGVSHSQANTPANTSPSLAERIARVGLAGSYGALFIGQQDVATDDTFTHDLAAAGSVMNANVATFAGGMNFRRNASGTFSNLTAGATNLTPSVMALGMNGALDSADAIRFNTATYSGFNGSLSASQGGNMDAALRYAADFGPFTVDSALGNKWVNNGTTAAADTLKSQLFASASVKHKSGLAATMAYTQQQIDNKTAGVEDPEGLYAKLGYAWADYGVAVDYSKFKNAVQVATDHEMTTWGLGADYAMGHGVTVGALYRNMDAKVAGVSNDESIDVGVVNMKVKF